VIFGEKGTPVGAVYPPSLTGAPSIDDSYRALTQSLPPRLAELAEALPWRLGLVAKPDGSWGEFVGLHPNRELPLYAAQAREDSTRLSLPEEQLHRFLRAHHMGGFYWLLRDRLRDGQVARSDERLPELAARLGESWRRALLEAAGDPELVELLIEDATDRWRMGTALERRVLAAGGVEPARYAWLVQEKLCWIGAPSRALLLVTGGSDRAGAFMRAHDLFLLSLQVIDDVIDRDEDRALYGGDVPAALRCSPGGLLRVAPKLAGRASAVAAGGGFTWWASWLSAFRDAIASWRLPGDGLADELEGIGIAGEMEEAAVDPDEPDGKGTSPPPAPAHA
jgi:hypothetical protein